MDHSTPNQQHLEHPTPPVVDPTPDIGEEPGTKEQVKEDVKPAEALSDGNKSPDGFPLNNSLESADYEIAGKDFRRTSSPLKVEFAGLGEGLESVSPAAPAEKPVVAVTTIDIRPPKGDTKPDSGFPASARKHKRPSTVKPVSREEQVTSIAMQTSVPPTPVRKSRAREIRETLKMSTDPVFYASRRAIFDPRRRAFRVSFEDPQQIGVPNLRLNKSLVFESPGSRKMIQAKSRVISSTSVAPEYNISVLPQIFEDGRSSSSWFMNMLDEEELKDVSPENRPRTASLARLRVMTAGDTGHSTHTNLGPHLPAKSRHNRRRHTEAHLHTPRSQADHPSLTRAKTREGTRRSQEALEFKELSTTGPTIGEDLSPQQAELIRREYSNLDKAWTSMKAAMPRRFEPKHPTRLTPRDSLFPRRPMTSHQTVLKQLYTQHSVFDHVKDFTPRQYFTA